MDRAKCQELRVKMNELLAVFAQDLKTEFNVVAKLGTGHYNPAPVGSADFKIEFAEIGTDGVVETKEAHAFKTLGESYGFAPEDFGKTFKSRDRQYTITGLNTKADRFPINATRDDGKGFKFGADMVLRALGKAPKTPPERFPRFADSEASGSK